MRKVNINELNEYMKWAYRYPLLTREEEKELAIKAKKGDSVAREKLIVSNLRFVVQVANQFKAYTKSGCYTLADLVQEGNVGLLRAIEKYNPNTGNKFITYAVWWIRASIMIYLTTNYSVIRFGTTSLERKSFFKLGILTELINTEGEKKEKLRKNVAKQLNITEKQVIKLEQRISADTISTNTKMNASENENEDCRLIEVLGNNMSLEENLTEEDFLSNFRGLVYQIMDQEDFTDREKSIIETRWLSHNSSTLQQVGSAHNISRERVRQIETRLFKKIREQIYLLGLDKEIENFLGVEL